MALAAPVSYDAHVRIHDIPTSDRPRERLWAVGATNLSTPELLAIILGSGTKKENVLHVAERLLQKFNGLVGVHRASIEQLKDVSGIGSARATQVQAALALGQRLLALRPDDRTTVASPDDVFRLVGAEMVLLEQEELRLILLDTRNRVISAQLLYRGSVNSAPVRVAEVMRAAVRENATALVLVHNHPSGDPAPSEPDVGMTRQVVEAGRLLDVQVLDHIIIAQQGVLSMKERGLGFP